MLSIKTLLSAVLKGVGGVKSRRTFEIVCWKFMLKMEPWLRANHLYWNQAETLWMTMLWWLKHVVRPKRWKRMKTKLFISSYSLLFLASTCDIPQYFNARCVHCCRACGSRELSVVWIVSINLASFYDIFKSSSPLVFTVVLFLFRKINVGPQFQAEVKRKTCKCTL